MSGHPFLQRWAEAVDADPENAHIGRWSSFVVRAEVLPAGDDPGREEVVRYSRGRVTVGTGADPDGGAGPEDAVIVLRGPRSAWRELADPHAAPRRHDLLALTKAPDGIEVVAGRDHLIRHLRVLNRLVELGRARG